MTSESASPLRATRSGPARSWLYSRVLWAGISIVSMWLAVLFVGIFGGDILSSTPGGTSTSVPVVVVLVPFVLPATVVVARRGFRPADDEPQGTVEEQQPHAAGQTSDLRTKLA